MAKNCARNLVYYAQLLKVHPLVPGVAVPDLGRGEAAKAEVRA